MPASDPRGSSPLSVVTRVRTGDEMVVPFSPEEVWRVIADVDAYQEWWPGSLGVSVIRAEPGLLGAEVEVTPFIGPAFHCRFEELHEPHGMRIRYFGGTLEGPGGLIIRQRDDGTLVRYELDVFLRAPGGSLVGRLLPLRVLHSIQLRQLLRALKARLGARRRIEAGPGVRQAPTLEQPLASESPLASAVHSMRLTPTVSNFDLSRRYLEALSSGATGREVARFFAPDAIHDDLPSRFSVGRQRDRDGIMEDRRESLGQWRSQTFDLHGATGGGSQVAMEVWWRGEAAPGTAFPFEPGEQVEARRALFLKFRDGLIIRQRAYDCVLSRKSDGTREVTAAPSPPIARRPAPMTGSNFEIARAYLDALSTRAGAEEIAAFFADDVTQVEFPNSLRPSGAVRDLGALLGARERSLDALSEERYELRGAAGGGSQVALEIHWTGAVARAIPQFAAGQKLEGRLAVFLKFRDGLIVRQRNYDCHF